MGAYTLVIALLAFVSSASAATYAVSTTVVGADGTTTVPWPPTCTASALNTYAVYDNFADEQWVYGCGYGTVNGNNVYNQAANNWRECFNYCATFTGGFVCTEFSYNNGGLGEAAGTCVLKDARPASISLFNNALGARVGVARRQYRE